MSEHKKVHYLARHSVSSAAPQTSPSRLSVLAAYTQVTTALGVLAEALHESEFAQELKSEQLAQVQQLVADVMGANMKFVAAAFPADSASRAGSEDNRGKKFPLALDASPLGPPGRLEITT